MSDTNVKFQLGQLERMRRQRLVRAKTQRKDKKMGCGVNPKTGKRYCDEAREKAAAAAKATAQSIAKGDLQGAATNVATTISTLKQGAQMLLGQKPHGEIKSYKLVK